MSLDQCDQCDPNVPEFALLTPALAVLHRLVPPKPLRSLSRFHYWQSCRHGSSPQRPRGRLCARRRAPFTMVAARRAPLLLHDIPALRSRLCGPPLRRAIEMA